MTFAVTVEDGVAQGVDRHSGHFGGTGAIQLEGEGEGGHAGNGHNSFQKEGGTKVLVQGSTGRDCLSHSN